MTQSPNTRTEMIDLVSSTLVARASRLTRLLMRHGDRELSRTEAGTLLTLDERPHRITELAETEALAQPTVTQLVDKLEARGLVERGRSKEDGRVVLVSISGPGRILLETVRASNRAIMRDAVEDLSDRELEELAAASGTMERLIETLQERSVDE